jgi:hypothetical protein
MRVQQEAVRQLVKSPPELWAQCSDAEALARHLNRFGEIRITRLEPESTVAWEGESVSGTVTLEASGWGTRVRLTAHDAAAGTEAGPAADDAAPAVVSAPALVLVPRGIAGWFSAFLHRRATPVADTPAREPEPPAPAPQATAASASTGPGDLVAELEAALDSLGQAHHRPYSRS